MIVKVDEALKNLQHWFTTERVHQLTKGFGLTFKVNQS